MSFFLIRVCITSCVLVVIQSSRVGLSRQDIVVDVVRWRGKVVMRGEAGPALTQAITCGVSDLKIIHSLRRKI